MLENLSQTSLTFCSLGVLTRLKLLKYENEIKKSGIDTTQKLIDIVKSSKEVPELYFKRALSCF